MIANDKDNLAFQECKDSNFQCSITLYYSMFDEPSQESCFFLSTLFSIGSYWNFQQEIIYSFNLRIYLAIF